MCILLLFYFHSVAWFVFDDIYQLIPFINRFYKTRDRKKFKILLVTNHVFGASGKT